MPTYRRDRHRVQTAHAPWAPRCTGSGGSGGSGSGDDGGGRALSRAWKLAAAAVLATRAGSEAKAQLLEIGDRLRRGGDWRAAHVAYLAAGWGVEKPHRSARLVLPGVDHARAHHRALRTPAATDALHVLEALEAARGGDGGGASGGGGSIVQGHKLRLAMVLADLGYVETACAYARSVRAKVSLGGSGGGGSAAATGGPYTDKFVTALRVFEDRLYTCAGVKHDGGGGGSNA
ncbi:hypothetical protein JKP88DRAFT_196946, partial [Tribonema minus]